VLGDLNELIRNSPLSPYIGRMRLARGVVLAGEGKISEAERDFQAARAQGEGAAVNLALGRIAFDRAHWEAAAREILQARGAAAAATGAGGQRAARRAEARAQRRWRRQFAAGAGVEHHAARDDAARARGLRLHGGPGGTLEGRAPLGVARGGGVPQV